MQPFQITSVLKELKSLKDSKAAGLDNIIGYLLKSAAHVIAALLIYIYNLSLSSIVFPNDWKKAKIMPVFKSGSRRLIENYRPISLLSILAKIFISQVQKQLYSFNPCQHGFQRRRSTNTVLLSVVDR